ncbi:MAG: PASTA domain-containing protein [Clostridia bacterium]|nr:PASTA domain-containing protein [Clostridia bacterium]
MLNTERLCVGCMNDNGGEKICSICGYDSKQQNADDQLPIRYWLKDRYLVGRVCDSNGEGITYIGWDNISDQIVNIREYFPIGIAARNNDKTVKIVEGNEFTFNEGILDFIELNRKLHSLKDLPALLQGVEVFEENGTAYSITRSVSGITLREFLIRNGGNLKWEQARPLFLPVITTLQGLHDAGILHRGISPETIIVGRDGKLKITGITIKAVRMSKSSMTAQLFPGFSAIEQYGYDLQMQDGKYTDVYGIAATLFRVLMGAVPTDASDRISNDNMQIPASMAETLPKYVLSALANALQIMPENRIKTIEAFRLALTPVSTDTLVKPAAPTKKAEPKKPALKTESNKKQAKLKKSNKTKKYAILSAAITAGVFIIIAVIFFIITSGNKPEQPNTPANNNPDSNITSQMPDGSGETIIPNTPNEKLYQVPDLLKRPYAEITKNIDYKVLFEFEVTDKQFSDTVPRGAVISQNPTSDQTVKSGTKIQLTLSLGPRMVSVPNVAELTKEQAVLELMKQGFLYENIIIENGYDATKKPNSVIVTEPAAGTKVDTDSAITVTLNTYTGITENNNQDNTGNSPMDGPIE